MALSPITQNLLMGPPESRRGSVQQPKKNPIDTFLKTPGGSFLMNLLAQQGYSPVPQDEFGAIGRAALMTQQQGRQRAQDALQEELVRSRIGLADAQRESLLQPEVAENKPLTDMAKLRADFEAGRISEKVYNSKRSSVLRESRDNQFDQTKTLRGEFRTDTDGVRMSQSALANAKALLVQGADPISATAAFTSFIRSIDNSVVRPAEQAAYSSAGGLARRLQDEISKLSGQGPLSEDTRRDLLNSIQTLEGTLEGIHRRTVDFYNKEAGKFELDPESVTGIPSVKSPVVSLPDQPAEITEPATALEAEIARLEAEIAVLDEELAQSVNN